MSGNLSNVGSFSRNREHYYQCVWVCRNDECELPTAMLLQLWQSRPPCTKPFTFLNGMPHILKDMWPKPLKPDVSEDVPADIRQCMLEAEDALISAAPRLARGAFRTVLDVATKDMVQKNPKCLDGSDPAKLNLNSRIDKLAKHHLITASLRDWAHTVRGITNEDVHGPGHVTKEEAEEIAEITRMILKYLYELPAAVEKMRLAAEEKKGTAEA